MRVGKASLCLAALAAVSVASSAHAVEHGSFGLGLNTSLSSGLATGSQPLGGAAGVISFRVWVAQNFAVDPQFGFAVRAVDNGPTTFGFVFGSRFLFSVANTKSLRFNVGGEFLFDIASVQQGNTNNTQNVPVLLLGPLMGVEYFFAEMHNLSFEVYLGLPIAIAFPSGATSFTMGLGGNIIAGFHYYF
jgi:hypothetical protein